LSELRNNKGIIRHLADFGKTNHFV
jgi:hypothetical protein